MIDEGGEGCEGNFRVREREWELIEEREKSVLREGTPGEMEGQRGSERERGLAPGEVIRCVAGNMD